MNKTIKIEGMMCEHCKKKVKEALLKVAKEVDVSLEKKEAILNDTSASDDALKQIIDDLGFEVTGIENE